MYEVVKVVMIVKQQMVRKEVMLRVELMHVMTGAEGALETGEVCAMPNYYNIYVYIHICI